jgi:predicted kinase
MLTKPTRLIVIGGFAGSGKSTLSSRLGRSLCLPVIDLDVIAHALQTSKDFSGGPGAFFDLAYALIEDLLRSGTSLIFQQNLGREQTWRRLKHISDTIGNVEFICLILDCPYDICASRVADRVVPHDRVSVTAAELEKHRFKWEYLTNAKIPDAVRLDATQHPDAIFEEVVRRLR